MKHKQRAIAVVLLIPENMNDEQQRKAIDEMVRILSSQGATIKAQGYTGRKILEYYTCCRACDETPNFAEVMLRYTFEISETPLRKQNIKEEMSAVGIHKFKIVREGEFLKHTVQWQ